MYVVGCRIESKPLSLTKQNNPKQSHPFPENLIHKPRGLMAANNNVYRTIRKKIFAVFFLQYKMLKVQERINADELGYPVSQFMWLSAN